jgi:hypothetical protein
MLYSAAKGKMKDAKDKTMMTDLTKMSDCFNSSTADLGMC